jgi:hypothetical protein
VKHPEKHLQLHSLEVLLQHCKAEALKCKSEEQKLEVCPEHSLDRSLLCSRVVLQIEKWVNEVSVAKEELARQPGIELDSTIKRIRQWDFKVGVPYRCLFGCV